MTDKKDPKKELTSEFLLADIMLRITSLEKILLEKGVFTQEELSVTTDEIAKRVAKVVLEKAQASKHLEDLVTDLQKVEEKKDLDN